MVFRDQFDVPKVKNKISGIAFPLDRFFSLLLDFIIISPFFSLVISPLIRIQRESVMKTGTLDLLQLVVVLLILVLMSVLYFSLTVYFYNGTVGQRVFNLRVVSMIDQGVLNYYQCFVRAFLQIVTYPFIVPVLGIYSHPYRRTFADLGSETLVVSDVIKKEAYPKFLEREFFRSWKTSIVGSFIIILAVSFFNMEFSGVHRQFYASDESNESECLALFRNLDTKEIENVLQVATVSYYLKLPQAKCLESITRNLLWSKEKISIELEQQALLGRLLKSDTSMQKKYLKRICDLDQDSEYCALAEIKVLSKKNNLRKFGMSHLLSRVLLYQSAFAYDRYTSALAFLDDFAKYEELQSWAESEEYKLMWKWQKKIATASDKLNQKSPRSPASETAKDNVDEFERQDIFANFENKLFQKDDFESNRDEVSPSASKKD